MAKEQTTTNKDLQIVNKAQDSFLNESLNSALGNFENLDDKDLEQVGGFDSEYLELETKEKYNFIFTGMGEITVKGEKVEVVKLTDKNEKEFVSGLKVLVNRLKTVTQLPCFVRIITKDWVKSEKGKYLDMDILVVPQTLQK